MQPLKTITQAAAIGGASLTAYGLWIDEFSVLQAFVLIVFFFWAHVYAHEEINM